MSAGHAVAGESAPVAGQQAFPWRFTTPLYVGSSLNPINSAIIATALVPIADGLHVSVGSTAVLVTSLYLASAIAQPTAGKLAEVVGPRRVFLGGILLVLLGGLVGGFGDSLAMLTVARVLIGIGTSAGYPSAMVLIRRRAARAGLDAPPGSVLGGLAIAGMATAAVGPPLGGLLVGAAGWHWAFLINIPVTVAALLVTARWVPKDPAPEPGESSSVPGGFRGVARRIDLAGIVGFAASTTALIIFLMSLPAADWTAFGVFVVAAVPTVLWELRAPEPFFDLRGLAANGPLSRTYLRQALTLVGVYTVMYGVTEWMEAAHGYSSTVAGLLLLPMAGVSALLARPLATRNLVRGPLVVSAVTMLAGSAAIVLLTSRSPALVIVLVTLIFGITSAATTVGNQTTLYLQALPQQIGTAAGLFRTFSYLGTIVSSVITGLVFHHGVTDRALHGLGLVLVGTGLAVLLLTVLDRRLMGRAESRTHHTDSRTPLP
ncbi:MFS transporter [Streptacidiphilus pinicola]|uniref:MFS transporter n=1 Tax=Streptacidiphilus pinicola TaxID=2219663 RepID=A0A2X0ILC1_9ACTN|nr:MFS transporter [Streptacidiphilus pinicola]RAG85914.1 MFS transporter [Streptacidiphilus pinicola]